MTKKRLRFAIVGLNHYHVCGWADTLRNLADQVEIVGIYDANPDRRYTLAPDFQDPSLPTALASEFQVVPFYSDVQRLINEQRPDAALVMDHQRDNPSLVTILAQHGVHAFLDKSGALCASDMKKAMDQARLANVVVAAGLSWRLRPEVQHTKRLIEAGNLGGLLGAEISMVSSTVKARNPNNHLFSKDLSGGGFTHWLHIHLIDAMLYLTGRQIVSVQAMTANVGGTAINVEDAVAAALEFDNGAIGMLYGGYVLPRWVTESHLNLHGTELSLSIRKSGLHLLDSGGDRRPVDLDENAQSPLPKYPGYGGRVGMTLIQDWIKTITDRNYPLSSTGDDLARALAIIDAIYASAQSGQRTYLS